MDFRNWHNMMYLFWNAIMSDLVTPDSTLTHTTGAQNMSFRRRRRGIISPSFSERTEQERIFILDQTSLMVVTIDRSVKFHQ